MVVVVPSCRLTWPWQKVWPLLLSQTGLCSVVWKYVVCLPVLPMMFNISFYGFASTGFLFLFLFFWCLSLDVFENICRTAESFCSIFVSRELSPLSLCQHFAVLFFFVLFCFLSFLFPFTVLGMLLKCRLQPQLCPILLFGMNRVLLFIE